MTFLKTHWLSSGLVAISKLLWLEGWNTPIVRAWNIFVYLDAKIRVNKFKESKEKQGTVTNEKENEHYASKKIFLLNCA